MENKPFRKKKKITNHQQIKKQKTNRNEMKKKIVVKIGFPIRIKQREIDTQHKYTNLEKYGDNGGFQLSTNVVGSEMVGGKSKRNIS